MKYFNTLPKMVTGDLDGNYVYVTNLLARASVKPAFLDDPTIFYKYDVKDSDTPESIAYKFYGDSYRYWIIMFVNELHDAQWNWPLKSQDFERYVTAKYEDPYATHHYEKVMTQKTDIDGTVTVNTTIISEDDYNDLEETTNVQHVIRDESCFITTTKKAVTNYDYEHTLNEEKRTIKLIRKEYALSLEQEMKKLMGN